MLAELRGLKDLNEQRAWFVKYVSATCAGRTRAIRRSMPGPRPPRAPGRTSSSRRPRDHYQPGRFTSSPASSGPPRPGREHAPQRDLPRPQRPRVAAAALDTNDEERLWAWMAEQEKQGRSLLAIPHNSNGSKGLMFEPVDNAGRPLTNEYARPAQPLRAPDRDDADQGQLGGAPLVLASRRVRRFREWGQRRHLQRTDLQARELCALGRDQGAGLSGEAWGEPLQAWLHRRHRQP